MEKSIGMAYARVSTDEQTEYSPKVQIENILEYAKKNNIYIPKEYIFVDEGISGKSAQNRPAFQQMIKIAKKKSNNVKFIIVHKFDRFSRKKDDQVLYKALLKKDGIKVISVKEPVPEDNKFGVIYESMLEAMAEYYSLNLAEEVKKTMIKKAESGQWQTTPPYGYRIENKSIVPVPKEAKIVRFIFKKYIEGTSILQITKMINDKGAVTHKGNAFENRNIEYILNNPVYCGYVRWTPSGKIRRNYYNSDSIIAKGNHQAIISEEIFKKATEIWKKTKNKYKKNNRNCIKGTHWLSGLVKCSSCGRNLVIVKKYKNNEFSMQCSGYNHGKCKKTHSITSKKLIPIILNELKNITEKNNVLKYELKYQESEYLEKKYRQRIKNIEKKLKRIKEAYINGIDTLEEYQINKYKLEKELENTKSKPTININKNSLLNIKNIYELLSDKNIPMEIKKEAAHKVIEKIIYDKENSILEIYLTEK